MVKRFIRSLYMKKDERLFSFFMFAYFFFVVTIFWIVKPLKKAAFVGFYQEDGLDLFVVNFTAAQAELLAKIINVIIAAVAVIIFSMLFRHFKRYQLLRIFSVFFIVCFTAFSLTLGRRSEIGAWLFYLYGDLFSTVMITSFFAFLNDSVTPDAAKRLYGIVGLGGVCGGAFGSIMIQQLITNGKIGIGNWMWVCIGLMIVVLILAILTGKRMPPSGASPRRFIPITARSPNKKNVVSGVRLLVSSPYLLAIAAIVGIYEIASTLIDFQFTATVLHYVERSTLGSVFSTAYAYMNGTALVVQLVCTGFILQQCGIKVGLMVLPASILVISVGYCIAPILAVAMFMPAADGGFAFSINQSAKEILYIPTSQDEKYKVKAVIDMFIQRLSKVLAICVSLLLTAIFREFNAIRWLSFVTIICIGVWIFTANFAGGRFKQLAHTIKQPPLDFLELFPSLGSLLVMKKRRRVAYYRAHKSLWRRE